MEPTCDRGLDVQHGLLLAQDGGPLGDDAQGDGLLHAALLGEVGLKEVHPGLPLQVEHLLHRQPVAQGEGDRWGGERQRRYNKLK